jgi:hypothetical protein
MKPLVKSTSKPRPKGVKMAAIELWTAKVPLAYTNKNDFSFLYCCFFLVASNVLMQ